MTYYFHFEFLIFKGWF